MTEAEVRQMAQAAADKHGVQVFAVDNEPVDRIVVGLKHTKMDWYGALVVEPDAKREHVELELDNLGELTALGKPADWSEG